IEAHRTLAESDADDLALGDGIAHRDGGDVSFRVASIGGAVDAELRPLQVEHDRKVERMRFAHAGALLFYRCIGGVGATEVPAGRPHFRRYFGIVGAGAERGDETRQAHDKRSATSLALGRFSGILSSIAPINSDSTRGCC